MEKTTLNLFNKTELSISRENRKIVLSIGDTSCELSPAAVQELVKILSDYTTLLLKEGNKDEKP